MRIIVITPEQTLPNEVDLVNKLFENGLQRLHLRKSGFADMDYKNYIQQIDFQHHNRIVLHASFRLVEQYGLGGIHLNSHVQKDAQVMTFARSLLPTIDVSASFHSWQEIEDNEFPYKYVFISPVYDSISKVGYKANIDLTGAMAIKQKLQMEGRYCPEIVGLGGVGVLQIEELHQFGFGGVAILGGIWESGNPIKSFVEVRDRARSLSDE